MNELNAGSPNKKWINDITAQIYKGNKVYIYSQARLHQLKQTIKIAIKTTKLESNPYEVSYYMVEKER